MADDTTRGRRGGDGRGERYERPSGGYPRRDTRDGHGQFGRDAGARQRDSWRGENTEPRGPRADDRPARPFQTPAEREEGWAPFGGHQRTPDQGDRRPDQDREARDSRPGFSGDRPPFRADQREDRPAFRSDRPSFRDNRGEGARPWERDNRNEGGRPSFGDRDQRPSYRQGRGGYRSFDQDLGRSERPHGQPFRGGGDRPPFAGRRPEDNRPPFQERRPFSGDRPSGGRREEGDRPYGNRRPDEDRPSFQDRRPSFGGRPFERRDEGSSQFANSGRPMGTVTRAGRSPVNQFERIQADVYGRWPVLESLRAGNVTKVYLAAGVKDSADHLQEIQTIAAEKHITVTRVDRFDLDRVLGNVNHQGVAAACRPFQYTPFEDVLENASKSGEKPLVVLFDGVQDPQNLGSILRTAEAMGADGAVLPKHNQAGVSPAVVRASAGAAEHLPVAEVNNLRQSVATLKEAGYWIVGLDMDGGTDYDNFDVESPIALVIGGEGRGLSRMISEECDYLVRLPMRGKVGSLNASVAAGIVLYEIGRRRGTVRTPKAVQAEIVAGDAAEVVLEDDELEDLESLEAVSEETGIDAGDELVDEDTEDGEFLPDDVEEGEEVDNEDLAEEEDDIEEAAEETELQEDEPGAAGHHVGDASEPTE